MGLGGPCLALVAQNVVRKLYSHLLGVSFLAVKVIWTQNGCLQAKNADYCKFVNEWVWLRSHVSIVAVCGLGFSFEVRAWTEIKILDPKCFSFEITLAYTCLQHYTIYATCGDHMTQLPLVTMTSLQLNCIIFITWQAISHKGHVRP